MANLIGYGKLDDIYDEVSCSNFKYFSYKFIIY